jgi:hypothetical protein
MWIIQRMQYIDAHFAINKKALDFLDAPSDLVPDFYEGELKNLGVQSRSCGASPQIAMLVGFAGNRVLEVS